MKTLYGRPYVKTYRWKFCTHERSHDPYLYDLKSSMLATCNQSACKWSWRQTRTQVPREDVEIKFTFEKYPKKSSTIQNVNTRLYKIAFMFMKIKKTFRNKFCGSVLKPSNRRIPKNCCLLSFICMFQNFYYKNRMVKIYSKLQIRVSET